MISPKNCEIICCIGDEELSRSNNNIINLTKVNNQHFKIEKPNKGYLSKISNDLQKLIVSNVKVPDDDEDENEWTISKACLIILNLMAQTAEPQTISNFYNEI